MLGETRTEIRVGIPCAHLRMVKSLRGSADGMQLHPLRVRLEAYFAALFDVQEKSHLEFRAS